MLNRIASHILSPDPGIVDGLFIHGVVSEGSPDSLLVVFANRWKDELESCAFVVVLSCPKSPTKRLDDRAAD